MPRLLTRLIMPWLFLGLSLPAIAAEQDQESDQEVCASRQSLLDTLAQDYRESPSAVGMANSGGLIEVFTARDGRTWTILVTRADGNSCIVAAGKLWTPVQQQLSATDDTI